MTFTKERQKKTLAALMAALLAIGGTFMSAPGVYAASNATQTKDPQPAYIKADVTIIKDGEILNFFDEKGDRVYPVFFRNRTYLPLRAICGLLGEEVEWVGAANTIYIGMTLSHPSKQIIKPEESAFVKKVSDAAVGVQTLAKAYIKEDIYILRDYDPVVFTDPAGETQYPINVGGTTYLPVSALSTFLGEEISWDGSTKTVILGSREVPKEPEKPAVDKDKSIKKIAALYEKQAQLYNEATEMILLISTASPEELSLLSAAISEKYRIAEGYNNDVKNFVKEAGGFTGDEKLSDAETDALANLAEFTEFCEHYLLVMENMMYLAAEGQDYSGFAETFLNFALMTQSAMDTTAKSLEAIL